MRLKDKVSWNVYLSYNLRVIVVFYGEDGEVKLLVGQIVAQRVPHRHVTMSQGRVVVL